MARTTASDGIRRLCQPNPLARVDRREPAQPVCMRLPSVLNRRARDRMESDAYGSQTRWRGLMGANRRSRFVCICRRFRTDGHGQSRFDAFQCLAQRAISMMLLLIFNISDNFRDIILAHGEHSVAILPVERVRQIAFLVDVMRRCTL